VTGASPNNLPSPEESEWMVNEKSHHVEILLGDDHYRLWMDKIGPYLGDWVLGEGRNGMFIIRLPRYDLYCTDVSTKTVSPGDL
jgi:hypothetical protein